MLTELLTAVFVLGLPLLLLAEEVARRLPVRAKADRALPRRAAAPETTTARRTERAA